MKNLNLLSKLPANNVTRAIGKGVHIAKKHSPLVMTVVGMVGTAATAYFAYKAAPRVAEIVEDMEEDRAKQERYFQLKTMGIKEMTDAEIIELGDMEVAGIPEFDRLGYIKQIMGAVALPVASAVVSITAIGLGYRIMNGRLNGLASALTSLAAQKLEQEKRIKENVTPEQYKAITGPATTGEIEVKEQDGSKKIVEGVVEKRAKSLNGVWFSESDEFAKDDHDYNIHWLTTAETVLLRKQKQRSFLLLNEVYDELGLPRTKEGAIMGWDYSDPFGFGLDIHDAKDRDGYWFRDIYINWVAPRYIYEDIDLDRVL